VQLTTVGELSDDFFKARLQACRASAVLCARVGAAERARCGGAQCD
jgi:hypothetical protein